MEQTEEVLRELIEVAESRAAEDNGREAVVLRGRLARLLRENESDRLVDAEDAYCKWMETLQTVFRGEEPAGSDDELIECLYEYIDVLKAQGKDPDNIVWELLGVCKRMYGNDSIEYANDLHIFGQHLASRQSYRQAEQVLKKALSLKVKNLGQNHSEVSSILCAIGRVLYEVGAFTDAAKSLEDAMAIEIPEKPPDDVIKDLRLLGMVYCRQGLYGQAEAVYRKVVNLDRHEGGEHPPEVSELNVLAVLLYAQGKMHEAEPLLKRVLSLRETELGPEHVDTAESLVNLAVLANKKGEYALALPMLNRALGIFQKAHGNLHPETVSCLSWIADTYQRRGKYIEAEGIVMEVVSMNRQILGHDHPGVADCLSDLAELQRAQDKLVEAEACHMEALRIREARYGPDHELVAHSAQLLSLLLHSAGREDGARDYARRVVAIRHRLHEAAGKPSGKSTNIASSRAARAHGKRGRQNHAQLAVEKSISR